MGLPMSYVVTVVLEQLGVQCGGTLTHRRGNGGTERSAEHAKPVARVTRSLV
jgi:hypothetical protein